MKNFILVFLTAFCLFTCNGYSIEQNFNENAPKKLSSSNSSAIGIAAVVNENIITTYELERRLELLKLLNPAVFKDAKQEDLKRGALEQLIREKLLKKQAGENNFIVPESDIKANINLITHKNKRPLNKELSASLHEQIEGEIIFSAILQSYSREKTNFTNIEIERFMTSYNETNETKINAMEAKNILTSMKYGEIEQSFLKSLYDNAFIERKV